MSFLSLKNRIKESKWLLGICVQGLDDLQNNNIKWVNNGKYEGKKWFADPFILEYNDTTIDLLVEEFDYSIHRGRIAHIVVERENWTITSCTIILDLPTHLSFPAIYRIDDKVYVCPENHASGKHNLYLYNQEKEKLEFVKTIYNGNLTDTTLAQINGMWYMFTTSIPHPNGNKLEIFRSDSFDGEYLKVQEENFKNRVGRNAGELFFYRGLLIRPAQLSGRTYGQEIVFQKVSISSDGKIIFDDFYTYESTHRKYNAGAHTYNEYKDMAVIDVKGYRYNFIGRFWDKAIDLAIKLRFKKQFVIE